jgi:hypothetical protein
MATSKGQMEITILEDGRIKVETDDMSGPAHKTADEFLKMVARLAGGETTEAKREGHHHHHHGHGHAHAHGHDHHKH